MSTFKLTQNVYWGLDAYKPTKGVPGALYIAVDTNNIYVADDAGALTEASESSVAASTTVALIV